MSARIWGKNSDCRRRGNRAHGFQGSPLVITSRSLIYVIGCGADITPHVRDLSLRRMASGRDQFLGCVTKHDIVNGISPTRVNSWASILTF